MKGDRGFGNIYTLLDFSGRKNYGYLRYVIKRLPQIIAPEITPSHLSIFGTVKEWNGLLGVGRFNLIGTGGGQKKIVN